MDFLLINGVFGDPLTDRTFTVMIVIKSVNVCVMLRYNIAYRLQKKYIYEEMIKSDRRRESDRKIHTDLWNQWKRETDFRHAHTGHKGVCR